MLHGVPATSGTTNQETSIKQSRLCCAVLAARSFVHLVVLLVMAATLHGCGDRERQAATRVARDDLGNPLPDTTAPAAQRVVSLNPTTTELFFALGAGAKLVGRTQYDVFPPDARRVPDLGPGMRPNVEAVLNAKPDLVVLYASEENRAAARALSEAGVRVVALRVDRIADFERATLLLARLVGLTDVGARTVDTVRATLARVRQATATLPRRRVLLPAWEDPLIVIGGGSFLSELVEIAGGRNIFADLAAPSQAVAFEEVVQRDPDALLVGPMTAVQIQRTPRWQAVEAVRERRLLVFDTLLVGRPSVRLGEAAVSLARLLHAGINP